jgi:hypothetical protein
MKNGNADVAMNVYRKLSEIFEHQAYLYEPAQVENRLQQAYSKLDDLVKVGDLLLNEPVWVCRRLESQINGNADVALDVYHILTKLLRELAQSDFRPTYTADESARLAAIHKQIQAASASPQELG